MFYTGMGLIKKRVKIQKLLVYDEFGKGHYLSVFPQIIIKYCPLSTDLLEFAIRNVRKGEDVLSHINDPDLTVDCEDPIATPIANMEKRCIHKRFGTILAKKYTAVSNHLIDISHEPVPPRYPHLHALYQLGRQLLLRDTHVFSMLNAVMGLF